MLIARGFSMDAASMNETELTFFRDLLSGQLAGLIEEAERTVEGMNGERVEFPDPTDRASLESDRNFDLRIRDRERKLIKKIREALDRIQDGSFGVCEECGGGIGLERLRARPVTTLCIACKAEQEAEERAAERAQRGR